VDRLLEVHLVDDTVTHGFEAWRIAATAATRSTSDRITPPNTLPMMFACCGIISSEHDRLGIARMLGLHQ